MKCDRKNLKSSQPDQSISAEDAHHVRFCQDKSVNFSILKGIAVYLLLSKGWLPSITLSLLTTVLGVMGILPTANAEEVPEQPNLGLGDATDWELGTGNWELSTGNLIPQYSLTTSTIKYQQDEVSLKSTDTELLVKKVDVLDGETASTGKGEQTHNTLNAEEVEHSTLSTPLPATADSPKDSEETQLSQEGLEHNTLTQPSVAEPEKAKEEGNQPLSPSTPSPQITVQAAPDAQTEVVPPNNTLPTNQTAALAAGEVRILTPQTGVTNNNSTNLVVQYNANDPIQVSVNQRPLDAAITTQQNRDDAQNIITQAWYNIPLQDGENTITVQAGNGTPASIQVSVRQTALRLEIAPIGDPRVAADGRSTITLQGRITDENGQLLSEDTLVTLTASAGKFVGADQDPDQPGFQVMARGGQFTAQLQSSLEAQRVRIRAAIEGVREDNLGAGRGKPTPTTFSLLPTPESVIETYTQVEFITNLRPSLVSGVIDFRIGPGGTNFWGRRADFLNPDRIDNGTQVDFKAAVFGTGRIGEWLFTGAYNSVRNLNETCDGITRLFRGPQFCEKQYPVYGDSSTVDYITPSIDSVYLRFERTSPFGKEPDYVMWGDYNTLELARESQLYSGVTRLLHGFKGNYNLGNLQVTGIYSGNIDGYQRDTIQPNGTSGYYFLSRRRLVPGSEVIFLETEEANRPGTVLSRKLLNRGIDYEIDYDRGTLMFRQPILATEFAFFDSPETALEGSPAFVGSTLVVRRIVTSYQYEGAEGGGDTRLYGGRLQYNFSQAFQLESWIGATYLRQDQGLQDFELYGVDFRFPLGTDGQIVGEYARSYDSFRDASGSAYRLEAHGRILPGFTGRAYYRSVDERFSNDSTLSFTPGQTRYGAAIAYSLTRTTTFRAGYDFEENFGISPGVRTDLLDLFNPGPVAPLGTPVNNTLETISAGILQEFGRGSVSVDFVQRNREDRVSDLFTGSASQLVSRLGLPVTDALTFRAQNELSFGNNDVLYPNRTTVGLDWRAYPGVTVRLAHQFFDGGILGNDSVTSLDTILSHNIGKNTTLTGRYSVIGAFNEVVGQGAVGINHRWVVAPGLRVNLGYEHTFSNNNIPTAAGVRFLQPYAIGQTAASLALLGGDVYSVGIEYTDNPDFKASGRFEHRTGAGNNNTVFSLAGAGKLSPALTVLARYEQANFANQLIEGLKDTANLRIGLAYRNPNSDRWNALMRYEYRKNPSTIPETLLFGSGTGSTEHVFAGEAIFAPSWRWEFYGKGAMRYSNTDLANNFSNSSTIFLSQLRAAYRLNYRMDLAVEGRWIGQNSPSYNETAFAVETGYYLTPDLRLALGYSFGSADDRDFTGYRSQGGVYFGVTFKINELFGGFGRQRVVPPQEQQLPTRPVATSNQPEAIPIINTTHQNLQPGF